MSDLILFSRQLDDGRVVEVVPLTFNRGRIIVGDGAWVDDNW